MTFLFEREHDLMNTLALAAMLILIVHPPSVFTISFQLSFSAVLSIIYGLSKVNKRPAFLSGGQKKKPVYRNNQQVVVIFSGFFFCHRRYTSSGYALF